MYYCYTRDKRESIRALFNDPAFCPAPGQRERELEKALLSALDELDTRDRREPLAIREGVDKDGEPYSIRISIRNDDGTPNIERAEAMAQEAQDVIEAQKTGAVATRPAESLDLSWLFDGETSDGVSEEFREFAGTAPTSYDIEKRFGLQGKTP